MGNRFPYPYPSYITTDTERILFDARRREQQVITAMQRRAGRNPLRGLLWRRPWRASHRPNWRSLRDTWQWLLAAHDCSDPAVGCSCSGGFRFPIPKCQEPTCPDFGDPNFGEATCPSDHASPREQ